MLAQVATAAPTTAPALALFALPAEFNRWLATPAELYHAGLTAAIVLIVAFLLFLALHKLLHRTRLTAVYTIAALALALFLGIRTLKPALAHNPNDPVTWWLDRLFAAVFLLIALRAIDRLIVVPVLSRGGRQSVPKLVHQIINLCFFAFAVLVYGSLSFGWDISSFLAGSAIISIVVGLALQETLGNFLSGLVMQGSPPFSLGDFISVNDNEGRVVDMTWRAVTIRTDHDDLLIIPNSTIAKADLINHSAPSRVSGRMVNVGLDYDVPPADACSVLAAAAAEAPGVLADPAPIVFILDFGDSAIVYAIRFWMDDPDNHEIIESNVRQSVWYRLKQRGYAIPFPMRTVEHISLPRKQARADAAAVRARAAAIDRVPLLAPLSHEQKHELAAGARDVQLGPGHVLFRQDDPGESFYIICRGSAEVLVKGAGSALAVRVATLGPGDFFGEMSALTGQPRSATIRAVTALDCVEIDKPDLHALFEHDPSIMEKISAAVAQRTLERDAAVRDGPAAPADTLRGRQSSILQRMISFFGLRGPTADR